MGTEEAGLTSHPSRPTREQGPPKQASVSAGGKRPQSTARVAAKGLLGGLRPSRVCSLCWDHTRGSPKADTSRTHQD